MRIKAIFAALCSSFLLFSFPLTANAQVMLPEGAVKGLPSDLTAMDSEGNVVSSDTGEYFFRVEDMDYGVTYQKDVQLMNLRDDKAYNIYFYVEPLWKDGQIDLEEGCECKFFLDGEEFYSGTVTGNGNFDLTEEVKDCGYYAPGESHTLTCTVIWDKLDVLHGVSNGHRLIDKDGQHVLVGPDSSGHVEGQIEFKWIFYAAVDESYVPPKTGILSADGKFWLMCMAGAGGLVLLLAVLLLMKRKKGKQEQ